MPLAISTRNRLQLVRYLFELFTPLGGVGPRSRNVLLFSVRVCIVNLPVLSLAYSTIRIQPILLLRELDDILLYFALRT